MIDVQTKVCSSNEVSFVLVFLFFSFFAQTFRFDSKVAFHETDVISCLSKYNVRRGALESERSEEPLVLSRDVSLLECRLDGLLGFFALRRLLESIGRDDTLERFEFESISCGHQVVVVDDLDERLDLVSLGHSLARH